MKFILVTIAIILVLGVASFLLPAIIGICIGIGTVQMDTIAIAAMRTSDQNLFNYLC